MGSGCNNSCSNLFVKRTPDTQIEYTGPAIASLGICTHDSLSEVEAVILQKLIDYSTGVGISIPDIDLSTCDAFASCLTCCGTCTDLPCLLECYRSTICSIFDDVEELKDQVDALLNGPYDTGCLTNLATNPTLNQIIQALITQYCTLLTNFNTLQTQVNSITANLATNIGNFLSNALGSCQGTAVLNKTGTGATTAFSLRGFCPIGTVMPYAGDVSKFDGSGLGYSNTDCCGWAICNGNNGTVNMSGLVPVGTGMGPAVITGMTFPYNTTGGEYGVTLTSAQVPATSVSVSGTHTHSITGVSMCKSTTNTSNNAWVLDLATVDPGTCPVDSLVPPYNIPHTFTNKISSTTQTLTGTIAGGGGSHSNLQPYRALYYIQRVS